MGKINLVAKKVTITKDILFVIECYNAALMDAGFTEEHPIDARLSFADELQKKGFTNKVFGTIGRMLERDLGSAFVLMPFIDVQLDSKTEEFNRLFCGSWHDKIKEINRHKHLSLIKLDVEEITQTDVHKPHILIMHLCTRLFAFSLGVGEALKGNNKYTTVLSLFANKLLGEGCPLYHSADLLDPIGIYLGCDFPVWVDNLKQLLNCQTMLTSHTQALQRTENLASTINNIIIKQLCAYLDRDVTKAQLHDESCRSTFTVIQDHIQENLIRKDEQYSQLMDSENPPTAQNMVMRYLDVVKKTEDKQQIKALYTLLEKTKDVREIIQGVQTFIAATGWLGILTGMLQLNTLDQFIKNYLTEATNLLKIPSNCNLLRTTAGSALIAVRASNLNSSEADVIELSSNFSNLQNTDFLNWVIRYYLDAIKTLSTVGQKYGMSILDVNKCSGLLPDAINFTTINTTTAIEAPVPVREFQTRRGSYRIDDTQPQITRSSAVTRLQSNENLDVLKLNAANKALNDATFLSKTWTAALTILGDNTLSELGQLLLNDRDATFHDSFKNVHKLHQPKPLPLINKLRDDANRTLLHLAVANKNSGQIEWLLYYGANVFLKDETGATPLSIAASFTESEHAILFRLLLKKAQTTAAPNQNGIETHPTLLALSDAFSGLLHAGLCKYYDIVQARDISILDNFVQYCADWSGTNYTEQRNMSQLKAWSALNEAEKSRDYEALLIELKALNNIEKKGGKFHLMIRETITKGEAMLKLHQVALKNEMTQFNEANKDKIGLEDTLAEPTTREKSLVVELRLSTNQIDTLTQQLHFKDSENTELMKQLNEECQNNSKFEQDKARLEQDKLCLLEENAGLKTQLTAQAEDSKKQLQSLTAHTDALMAQIEKNASSKNNTKTTYPVTIAG